MDLYVNGKSRAKNIWQGTIVWCTPVLYLGTGQSNARLFTPENATVAGQPDGLATLTPDSKPKEPAKTSEKKATLP